MTFERLKILVAAALIIFVFLVGNIFIFGFLQKSSVVVSVNSLPHTQITQTNNAVIIDTRKENKPANVENVKSIKKTKRTTPPSEKISSVSSKQKTTTSNPQNIKKETITSPMQTSQPTRRIYYRRTRAS